MGNHKPLLNIYKIPIHFFKSLPIQVEDCGRKKEGMAPPFIYPINLNAEFGILFA